jgi:hypothetical protein
MKRTFDTSGRLRPVVRAALALIAVLSLAACGGGTFAQDPFGDGGRGCGDGLGAWQPGCATKRNIAAQAERAGDLERPRGEGPRDSMRRDAVFSGYVGASAKGERGASSQPTTTGEGR